MHMGNTMGIRIPETSGVVYFDQRLVAVSPNIGQNQLKPQQNARIS